MSTILMAKKRRGQEIYQTLYGHTKDALAALSYYLRRHRPVLEPVTVQQGMTFPDFCAMLFLAVFLHDLGKATREFQERLRLETLDRDVSHTFFALPLIRTNLSPQQNALVRVLTLSHHTQPFDRLYYSFYLLPRVHYLTGEIKAFINTYAEFYHRYGRAMFPPTAKPLVFSLPQTGEREKIRAAVRELKQEFMTRPDTVQTKALYALAITILKHCDGEASRAFSETRLANGTVCGETNHLSLTQQGENYFGRDKDYASTGRKTLPPGDGDAPADLANISGSSKAIFQRALDLMLATKREKFVWICPGQTVPPAVHARLAAFFGPGNTGLVHALSYFPTGHSSAGEPAGRLNSNGHGFSVKYGDRIFNRPVTAATVDHLVFSLVHGFYQADYALGNLLTAVIILDGLPKPDSKAREYTLDALALLQNMGVPCLLVTEGRPVYLAEAEELTADRQPVTNLAAVFHQCTLFGPSPWEVRYGPAPLIDLWPPGERLIDVIPVSRWRPEMAAYPEEVARHQVKIPLTCFLDNPQDFTIVDGPVEKYVIQENFRVTRPL